MDNRTERIAVPVSISGKPAQNRKPAASKAAIEQTPNTRGGYLVAFAAGLLTCPGCHAFPVFGQWQVAATFLGDLQQRVLFRIRTGFPFNPVGLRGRRGTTTSQKYNFYKYNPNRNQKSFRPRSPISGVTGACSVLHGGRVGA